MRPVISLALCVASCVEQVKTSQPRSTPEDLLIAKVRDCFWEAFRQKDVALLRSTLADDYYEPTATGVVTKRDVLSVVAKVNMRDFALDNFKVIRLGTNAAIVSYNVVEHWTMDGQEGPPHLRTSTALMNRGGKWVIVFHQETTAK